MEWAISQAGIRSQREEVFMGAMWYQTCGCRDDSPTHNPVPLSHLSLNRCEEGGRKMHKRDLIIFICIFTKTIHTVFCSLSYFTRFLIEMVNCLTFPFSSPEAETADPSSIKCIFSLLGFLCLSVVYWLPTMKNRKIPFPSFGPLPKFPLFHVLLVSSLYCSLI